MPADPWGPALTVLRLADWLEEHDAEAEFEKAVEALLDRIAAQLSV